jgi:hypothetical protein
VLVLTTEDVNELDDVVSEETDEVVVAETVPHAVVGEAVTQEQRAFAPFKTSTAVVPGHALRTDNWTRAWIEA